MAHHPVVTRCAAVASHGRRCQQTPYQGSGYCWHHLRSKKVPRPSRPPSRRSPAPAPRTAPPAPAVSATRTRLDRMLGPDRVRQLLAFLESDDDATFTLSREGGLLGPAGIRPAGARRDG